MWFLGGGALMSDWGRARSYSYSLSPLEVQQQRVRTRPGVLSGARVLAADPSSPRPADSWLDRGGSMSLASPYFPFSNRFWGEARSILRQGAPPPSGNAVVRVLLMLLICVCRITVLLLQMHLLVGSISVLKTSIYSSDIKGSMPASERQWCMKWHKIEIIK